MGLSPPSVSRLSPREPSSKSHSIMGLRGLLQDSFSFFHADDVRTSHETHAGLMTCYADSFTLLLLHFILK
jgi:hypothetical protein